MVIRILLSLAVILLLFAFRKRISPDFMEKRLSAGAPYLLSLLSFIIYLAIKFNRHHALATFGFDLSAFDYAYYNALHGEFLYTPFFGQSYLAEHFFPAMLLALPFYALYQHVETLLVLQALMVAAAAFPFYALVRHLTKQDMAALLFTVALMMNPYLVSGMEFDFHVEMMQPLLFCLILLFAVQKKTVRYLLCLLLFILTKENEWITAAALSLPLFFWLKNRRLAAYTLALGLASGLLILLILKQGHVAGFANYMNRYGQYGQTPGSIFIYVATHPGLLFSENTFRQAAKLLFTTAFLPLLSPLSVAALPDFFIHLLSSARQQKGLLLYYAAGIMTMLFTSAAAAYAMLREKYGKRGLLALLFVPLIILNAGYLKWVPVTGEHRAVIALCRSVPENSRVAADNELIPQLKRQKDIMRSMYAAGRVCEWEYIMIHRVASDYIDREVREKGCFNLLGSAGEYRLYQRRP